MDRSSRYMLWQKERLASLTFQPAPHNRVPGYRGPVGITLEAKYRNCKKVFYSIEREVKYCNQRGHGVSFQEKSGM